MLMTPLGNGCASGQPDVHVRAVDDEDHPHHCGDAVVMKRREPGVTKAARKPSKRNNVFYRDVSSSEMRLLSITSRTTLDTMATDNNDHVTGPPTQWGVVLKNVTSPVYKNLSPVFQKRALRYFPAYTAGAPLSLPEETHAEPGHTSRRFARADHLSDREWVSQWRTDDTSSEDDLEDVDLSPLSSPLFQLPTEETHSGDIRRGSVKTASLQRRSLNITRAVEKYSPVLYRARSHGPGNNDEFSLMNGASYQALRECRRISTSQKRTSLDLTGTHIVLGEAVREHTRRLSMPHPIKERLRRSPPSKRLHGQRKLRRSKSAPDLATARLSGLGMSKKQMQSLHLSSLAAGDLAVQPGYGAGDDDDGSETRSIGAESQLSSDFSFRATHRDEMQEEQATIAEALWDHVTMDKEELGFRAGQDVEVLDMRDHDWWYGKIEAQEGWFPAIFVRLMAIQADTTEEVAVKIRDGKIDKEEAFQRYSCNNLLSRDEARTNVVCEIINAERDYVKHLKDIVKGYIAEAKQRKNMFPETRLHTLFGNFEEIYEFSKRFLDALELGYKEENPKQSQLGSCFTKHKKGFVMYSEYCNNHPSAVEEHRFLKKDTRYVLFFEGCQLLQDMKNIPLDGFLLTPIQKICKYPLQLRELLKHTKPDHPDYPHVEAALSAMQEMALLINERKRKIESLEKISIWQEGIGHWTGPDLTESSSELIHTGEMVKINHRGSHQERVFFLFDNQLIYCKKDNLRRDELLYRGRVSMRDCTLYTLEDSKESKLKNAFRIDVPGLEKPYIIYCREKSHLERWFEAFSKEQALVKSDRENGFNLVEFRTKMEPLLRSRLMKHEKNKGRKHHTKATDMAIADSRKRPHALHTEKKGWFTFRSKKT